MGRVGQRHPRRNRRDLLRRKNNNYPLVVEWEWNYIFRSHFPFMEIGDFRFEIVPDAEFWLDGGAMFGVVPRVLWERVCPPDDRNRIRLNMNCAFIETRDERILIDTGIGEKWTDKETAIYGIDRVQPLAETLRDI